MNIEYTPTSNQYRGKHEVQAEPRRCCREAPCQHGCCEADSTYRVNYEPLHWHADSKCLYVPLTPLRVLHRYRHHLKVVE